MDICKISLYSNNTSALVDSDGDISMEINRPIEYLSISSSASQINFRKLEDSFYNDDINSLYESNENNSSNAINEENKELELQLNGRYYKLYKNKLLSYTEAMNIFFNITNEPNAIG